MNNKLMLFISALFFLFGNLFAATTGKIVGRVTDAATGEPLAAANVVIAGMPLGAATDLDGYYVILNVPPGVYTLRAMYIGYSVSEVKNVQVKVGLTTTINFRLKEASFQGETIVTVAKRPLIQKDATATAAVVTAKEMKASPIENFTDIAQIKAGVNVGPDGALHFRGGRSSEVAYIVDGIPVTNAIDGGMTMDVSTNAIEELSLITGSFSAEYGQAMSGVVNIVTKEGGSKFSGDLSVHAGDIVTRPENSKYFLPEIKKIDPLNTVDSRFQLSGPLLKDRVTFNISGRYLRDNGYLYGRRIYDTRNIYFSNVTGDSSYVSLNSNKRINIQNKFKFRLTNSINFYFTTLFENRKYQTYNHRRSKVPQGIPWNYDNSLQLIGKINHQFSSKAFYTLAFGYLKTDYKYYLDKNEFSTRYVWGGYSTGQYFYPGGTDNHRVFENQKQMTLKWDLTAQLLKNHEFKTGLEFKYLSLFHHSYYVDPDRRAEPFVDANNNGLYDPGEEFTDINLDGKWNDAKDDNGDGIPGNIIELQGWTNDKWNRHPKEFAYYMQDKIELKDMVVNVGLRFDYFEPDGHVLADPTDPDITAPIKNKNIWKDYGTDGIPNTHDPDGTEGNGVQDPGEPIVTLQERETYWYKKVKPSWQLSPRISFAFPISADGKLFFSYGHFFQLPPYRYLYTDYNNHVKPGLIQTDMGNPALKPQKTISYEVGIEQQLMPGVAGYLKIYQRDIRNIIGQKIIVLPNTDAYAMFINHDYGRVRGINFTLVKQFSSRFSATIDYTYQIAEGNESSPTAMRTKFRLKEEAIKKIVPLDWDQTHTLRLNGMYSKPDDWMVSMIGRIESGYPYTPMGVNEIVKISEENSARKIPIIKFDLTMRKYFKLNMGNSKYLFSVYTKIYNLFDRLNEKYVWDSTGRATYGLGLFGGKFDADWQRRPHWFYKPREIFLGVEFSF